MLEMTATWEGLDEAFDALTRECEQVVRGITVEAWNAVLRQTPQYYGRAVASWTYTIGRPVFVDRSGEIVPDEVAEDDDSFPVRSKGDPTAIGVANSFNIGADRVFKLGDTVWFANGVDHGEGPYSVALEVPHIRLRSANRPGQMVSRALDLMQSRYGHGVSAQSAQRLKGLSLGL